MSQQGNEPVIIEMQERSQGINYANEAQGDQMQNTQSNNELITTDQHSSDSIIPIDEAVATDGSLAQQNDQEQLDASSSATSEDNRIPLIIEKALVIDISADKRWIASIVERSEASDANKQFYLKMNKLYDYKSDTLDGTGYFREENISKLLPGDLENYFYFLSVLSNGRRVAISFLPAKKLSESPVLDLDLACAPTCLVFLVDEEGYMKLDSDAVKVQGKATFFSDRLLAVMNTEKNIVMVYDSNNSYKLIRWYDIAAVYWAARSDIVLSRLDWSNTHLLGRKSSVNQHHDNRREPISQLPVEVHLQLSEFMKDNAMVSAHVKNIIRVWSLKNGCRLTSFQTSTPEVPLALSDYNEYIATFSKSASLVNIYHIKTGLVSNTLKTTLGEDLCSKQHLTQQMVYAQFCDQDRLLFLIQVRPLKLNSDTNNALITFEGWDIAAEKLLIKQAENIRVNWEVKNSYVEPYIIEHDEDNQSPYTALYTTLVDNDSCEFKSLSLDGFKKRDASGSDGMFAYNWVILSESISSQEKQDDYIELTSNLHDNSNATCFRLEENPNVVMRIGRHTLQLWHFSDQKPGKGHSSQDRLIYICVLGQPLDYYWYRWDTYMNETPPSTPRISNTENRDASGQETQSPTESVIEAGNSDTKSQVDGLNFKDYLDGLGIAFHDNILENMLSISLCKPFSGSGSQYTTSMKIYLQLENLTLESYNVCTEYHYVESAISALKFIESIPEDQRTRVKYRTLISYRCKIDFSNMHYDE